MIHRESPKRVSAICGAPLADNVIDEGNLSYYLEGLGEHGNTKPEYCRQCWLASLKAVAQAYWRETTMLEYVISGSEEEPWPR